MTEAQLKAFPAFKWLPIYDESDARANEITTQPNIHECATILQVEECLRDTRLIALGGLRAQNDGSPIVVAYFSDRPDGHPASP